MTVGMIAGAPARRHRSILVSSAFALLAFLALGLTPARVEAAPITCGFGGASGDTGGTCGFFDETAVLYSWQAQSPAAPYAVYLDFDEVGGPFSVTINDLQIPQTSYVGRGPGVCIPIANGISTCVEFEVTAPPSGENTWSGDYLMTVLWDINTNAAYPDEDGRIRLLHNRGDVPGTQFDSDITILGSYCPANCSPFGPGEGEGGGEGGEDIEFLVHNSLTDPAISGLDDNFQSFIVVQLPAQVPEAATLLMLGGGLAAFYRRRRTS